MYYLIRKKTGGGSSEALDSEFDSARLLLGDVESAQVQLPGLGGVLEIDGRGEGSARFKSRKVDCRLNGSTCSKGALAPGDKLEVAAYELEVFEPPQGFDFALQVTALEGAVSYAASMDLSDAGWNLRRYAWVAALVVLFATLLVPALGLLKPELATVLRNSPLPDDGLWSSGPLIAAHRTAGIAVDCQACHTTPFVMVEDAACLSCHRDLNEHVDLSLHSVETFAGQRCASCHREHNEPARISRLDPGLCVDCHGDADVWKNTEGNGPQAVTGFTASTHPEFRLALMQPQGPGAAHGWAVNRLAGGATELNETSNLKFTHKVHLDPEKVQQQTTGEALACNSCHEPKDDGQHFVPITMDAHCRSCHSLSFDVFEPELELPHGDLRAAIVAMEAHFIREFTDPLLRRQRAADKPRRVPGKRESAASCQGNGLDCGRAEALKEAQYQFAETGCITCHVVMDTGAKDINDRWFVQPVRVTRDWYPQSVFDHSSHLSQTWDEPGEVCESCHAATESDESADILIPGQENCLACHAGDSGRGVAVDCVSCHAFHSPVGSPAASVRTLFHKESNP